MLYQVNSFMRIVRFISNFLVGFALGFFFRELFPDFAVSVTL